MKVFDHVGLTPIITKAETINGQRFYPTPEGNKYPSVTTVISNNKKKREAIAKWRERVGADEANRKTNSSATRGTRYHKIIEDYLNNELDLDNYQDHPVPLWMFHSSKKVLDRINKIYLQEAALYSDVLKIAGRVDCIAEFDGELAIIDFKSSEKEKKEEYLYDYFVQEQAYALMLFERYDIRAKKLVTIVGCESGETQVSVRAPNVKYILSLQQYIKEYQERYEGIIGG